MSKRSSTASLSEQQKRVKADDATATPAGRGGGQGGNNGGSIMVTPTATLSSTGTPGPAAVTPVAPAAVAQAIVEGIMKAVLCYGVQQAYDAQRIVHLNSAFDSNPSDESILQALKSVVRKTPIELYFYITAPTTLSTHISSSQHYFF
jgi:hypothetical protein